MTLPLPAGSRTTTRLITAATLLFVASEPAPAVTGPAGPESGRCSSVAHSRPAEELTRAITRVVSERHSTVAVAVEDPGTGLSCAVRARERFDSASVIKVTIMGAVLRRAQDEGRALTPFEEDNLRPMIVQSDNDAATALWRDLGRARLAEFLRLSGMADTVLADGDRWGRTQITAGDEMKQLAVFAAPGPVLTPEHRAFGLDLMNQVEEDQAWGAPLGAPDGTTVHVKNGWAPRERHAWHVHSLGIFTDPGEPYRIAILTRDNPSEEYGIDTVQAVAQVVHAARVAAASR
ncbi:class A beta-lactamase-related serine hydrolase [Kitasatospora sp. NBC_01246]|uniref:serine hydrolase n=1 Tax=Kitasatospora sp. NBC_01246 TaxID=2903570 RepID=UPI002E34EE4A|nr:serine hydrolase [Kitasatospora sp. NBC_01246]